MEKLSVAEVEMAITRLSSVLNYIRDFETDMNVKAKAMFLVVEKMYRIMDLASEKDEQKQKFFLDLLNLLRPLAEPKEFK